MSAFPAWDEVDAPPPPPALLQQIPFRWLSYSRFLSRIPQNALNLALVLLVLDATGKAFYTSLLVLALVVPAMIAGIAAGVAADAIPRRLIVALGNIARAAVCIGFIVQPGGDASLYFVAILLAVFAPFVSAAEGSILPAVVKRSELARANAIGHAVGGAAQIVGFAVLTPSSCASSNGPTCSSVSAPRSSSSPPSRPSASVPCPAPVTSLPSSATGTRD